MMLPEDAGMRAFHGDADLKAALLERLQWYETQGDASLKRAMLQEKWHDRAQGGAVFNPYPKIVQAQDIAGIRIGGDVSTLYALGEVKQNRLFLLDDSSDRRIYIVQYALDETFKERLGVPPTLVSILSAISKGLAPERETSWLRQFWAAVPVGASLWQVPMHLVLWALSDPSHGIAGLSKAAENAAVQQSVHDFLALYQNWVASGRTESPEWFPFYSQAESIVKDGWRPGNNDKFVHDLPASERCCLLAAAAAARTADVEKTVTAPLPKGTLNIQIVGDSLGAPGKAISQAGLYASEMGVDPSNWYETCASVLVDILADCPVPDRPNE